MIHYSQCLGRALIWLGCGLLRGFERAASFARGAAGVVSGSRTGAGTR